jgi:hypothetical protein
MLNEIQDFSLKMDGEVTSNKKYETRSSKYKKNEVGLISDVNLCS